MYALVYVQMDVYFQTDINSFPNVGHLENKMRPSFLPDITGGI